MATLDKVIKLLKLWEADPEAFRKLERLMDEAPRTIDLYQNQALTTGLRRAAEDEGSEIAIMNPDRFKDIASDIGDQELMQEKVRALSEILRGNPTGRYDSLISGDGLSYSEPGRLRAQTDPGFEEIPYLRFDNPFNSALHARGHEGRHRSRALSELGEQDALVMLRSYNDFDIAEELRRPDTEILKQDTGGTVGYVPDLFKILSIGGLAGLPMAE